MVVLLALFAAIALIVGACSTDDKSSENDDDADTAAADDSGEAGDDPQDPGTDTGADFSTTVEEASGQLEKATTACDVFDAVGLVSDVSGPEAADDIRAATDYYVLLLTKMGETSADPAVAQTLANGAAEFQKYAESVDYDSDELDLNGSGPAYPGAAETEAAMDQWLNSELSGCIDPSLSIPAS
jgi:hypothetical protein